MISIQAKDHGDYDVFCGDVFVGTIETYRNPFHTRNCYLKLHMDWEGISNLTAKQDSDRASRRLSGGGFSSRELFSKMYEQLQCPLQVMIDSTETETIALLQAGGFLCVRRCYEVEAAKEDQRCLSQEIDESLLCCEKGTPGYREACQLLYEYYGQTHETINPLTANLEMFCEDFPPMVLCQENCGRIQQAAFVEENEIAFVGTRDLSGFRGFAANVVAYLLERYDEICFECDDCDPAAMALKALFRTDVQESFDTYIYRGEWK